MFGFGRKSLPLQTVAALMAQFALLPLENPSEQDLFFRKRATDVGMDPSRFTLEAIALQTCAMAGAINRERLEGRMTLEKEQALIPEFLRAVHNRLIESTAHDLLRSGLDPDGVFELFTSRAEPYSEPGWGRAAPEDIPRFFAELCGFPDSPVLRQIAWYLFFVRGDRTGDWLKSIKIV